MPTIDEMTTIQAQLESMKSLDCAVSFKMQPHPSNPDPIIRIKRHGKEYNFTDPDYGVVIAQIAQLWKTIKKKNPSDPR